MLPYKPFNPINNKNSWALSASREKKQLQQHSGSPQPNESSISFPNFWQIHEVNHDTFQN